MRSVASGGLTFGNLFIAYFGLHRGPELRQSRVPHPLLLDVERLGLGVSVHVADASHVHAVGGDGLKAGEGCCTAQKQRRKAKVAPLQKVKGRKSPRQPRQATTQSLGSFLSLSRHILLSLLFCSLSFFLLLSLLFCFLSSTAPHLPVSTLVSRTTPAVAKAPYSS
jgi:hypothetical protein